MIPASLEAREAFLITLLGKDKMYHGSYIREKVSLAMLPDVESEYLKGCLDEKNQEIFDSILDAH